MLVQRVLDHRPRVRIPGQCQPVLQGSYQGPSPSFPKLRRPQAALCHPSSHSRWVPREGARHKLNVVCKRRLLQRMHDWPGRPQTGRWVPLEDSDHCFARCQIYLAGPQLANKRFQPGDIRPFIA